MKTAIDETAYHYGHTTDALAPAKLSLLTLLAFAIVAITLLSGCTPKASHQTLPPPPVTVAPVEHKEIVEWDEFTGRTEAVESVDVKPRVSGYIQAVKFQSGQLVKNEVLEVDLPAVLTAQKGLAEPRLPGLKGIMAAKKKPLVEKPLAAAAFPTEVRALGLPPGRQACVKVPATREGVQQLLKALRGERGVL